MGDVKLSFGRRTIGRYIGQETTNIEAKLYAQTAVRGVSKAVGNGEAPIPVRR